MAKNNKQAANQDGNSTKKATKKKKKVKVSHIVKPENMTLEEWQIKLRKQVTDIEHFNISCVDDALCPGEYIVRNPEKNNEYKVVYLEPTANGIIVPAWISRLRDSALANISKPSKNGLAERGAYMYIGNYHLILLSIFPIGMSDA